MRWETVIGLEVHVQLTTKSKIFSSASTAFGAEPNTQISPVDLGLPGVLPVVNREVVEAAMKLGCALGSDIHRASYFARKHYFYPDSPKGYQISQHNDPIVRGGTIEIPLEDGSTRAINLTRAHLEEDAGKSIHNLTHGQTGIDLNRAGTALLEVVSEPEMHSAKEAVAYAKALYNLVCYLGICDGNLQEGSFRVDANVSVRPEGQEKLGTRCELKNINSFRFIEKAIDYEVERHIDILESGGRIRQETRLYDAEKNETRTMRSKENAEDYRYFPDPDLLPIMIDDAWLDAVKKSLPELPEAKRLRFQSQFGLSAYDANVLTAQRAMADYFESVVNAFEAPASTPKQAANWITGELSAALNREERSIENQPISPSLLARLIDRIQAGIISGKSAKILFESLWQMPFPELASVDELIDQLGLKQVSDAGALDEWIAAVINENPAQVEEIKNGKEKALNFLVGQVMKRSKGQANPSQVSEGLKNKILA
ncbi:MAG: Asp-tRNA(Asn)/Glu-tRNA(Gln) amidotransferase subunit GatB [Pseudomonadota bacterium]